MKNFTVTIHDCSLGRQTHSVSVEADSEAAAKTAAILSIYGDDAYIEPNHGLGSRYGQVFNPCKTGRSARVSVR